MRMIAWMHQCQSWTWLMLIQKRFSMVALNKATIPPLWPSSKSSQRSEHPQQWITTRSQALKNRKKALLTSSRSALKSRVHRVPMPPRTTLSGLLPSSQTHEPKPSWNRSMNKESCRMRMLWRQRISSCGRVQSNHPWTLTPKTKWNCPPRLRWYRSRSRQMTKTRMPRIQSSPQLSMIGCLEHRMLIAWRACRHISNQRSSKPMSTRWESKILIETNLSSRVNLLLLISIERIVWRGSIKTTRNWHWREVLRKLSRWDQLLHK